jgi:hypothetical protein
MTEVHNLIKFWTKGMNQSQEYSTNKVLWMGSESSFLNNKPKENITGCFDLFMFRYIDSNKSF